MITNEFILEYIDLSFNVSIAFLGIGFTIFTLLYAFIQNKKDVLKEIEEIIKLEGGSMSVLRKKNSAVKFISKMRKINVDAIIIIISSFICLIITSITKLFEWEFSCYWLWCLLTTLSLYVVIIIGSFIRAFVRIIQAYNNAK